MELGTLKHSIFHWFGWASVTLSLWMLLMANIWILTSYETMFNNVSPMILLVAFVMGTIALLRKTSRSLGIWGISLTVYLFLFLAGTFVIGWMINPFP